MYKYYKIHKYKVEALMFGNNRNSNFSNYQFPPSQFAPNQEDRYHAYAI